MSRALRRSGWDVLGIAVFVVMVFPVFWMISTAFKPDDQIISLSPTWFSSHPTLAHFTEAIHRPYFWQNVKNSVVIVLVTVAISIVLAFLAAVALAKYRFTGRKLFIVLVIGIQMLPTAGLIIPLYVVLARYHLVNALTVATSVFAFISSWNEYLFARVLLNDQSKQTVTIWLSYFLGTSRHTDWGALMAGSTLTAIPVVVFFLIVQKKIAFGLTAGAVKG